MPVIVVGADTDAGEAIVGGLCQPGREVRAFVSDESSAISLRRLGVKVALGDVSDESHVEAAATGCFTAVLVSAAATDHRERSFAKTPAEVLDAWAGAMAASRVRRVIWIGAEEHPPTNVAEVARVDPAASDLARRVVALDEAQTI